MSENVIETVQNDVTGLEQVAVQQAPVIEDEVKKDETAWDTAVNAAVELGHRAEDTIELLDHLWKRGVAIVMHSQPASASGDETPNVIA